MAHGSLSYTHPSLADHVNLCDLCHNLPNFSCPYRRSTFHITSVVYPGAGISSICHMTRKARVFPKVRASHPSQDEYYSGYRKMADSFRVITEDFVKQNKKIQEMDGYFEHFKERNGNLDVI